MARRRSRSGGGKRNYQSLAAGRAPSAAAMNNYPAQASTVMNPADVGQRRMPAMGMGQGMM